MLATPRVRPAGSSKAWTSTSFLLAAAGVQILLFVSFIGFFFTTEQHRQGELSDMQGELQRLRAENARQSKRLIHSNKRMLRYEADIRAEIGAALHPDEEDEEDEEDADGDGDEDAAGAEDGDTDGLPAADEHHGDHGVGRGSIAPAAHIEPVAAARALSASGDSAVASKRLAIVHALRHAWRGYEKHSFGQDEVRPISGKSNNWIGLGLTIVDSLDTLWLAGLREEYHRGIEWVHTSLSFDKRQKVSFFETTIRCLGGLLAMHEISGDPVLLTKASELGERLGKAFSSGSGMPYSSISLVDGSHVVPNWLNGNVLLAEVGTVQLEFASLSAHTGNPTLRAKSDKVFDLLDRNGPKAAPDGGRLWPIHIRPETGAITGTQISWGAMGDSFYEYLLKYWLLTGKKHDNYKRMYLEAVQGMISKLLHTDGGVTFVAESNHGRIDKKMDHLVCFVPGMLALGAQHIPEVAEEHMRIAKELGHTCYQMYAQQKTGLSPEYVRFPGGGRIATDPRAIHNLLRPEAIEAIFYLWRFTKDPKYREWGWRMFLAFEKYSKVPTGGYVGYRNVGQEQSAKDDKMETFWIAETLKYFLLLFSDDSLLDLNTHVLNTEAHPLRILSAG